jgi:hypothetical protein
MRERLQQCMCTGIHLGNGRMRKCKPAEALRSTPEWVAQLLVADSLNPVRAG